MEPSYDVTFGYGFLGMLPGVIMADALASADRDQEALALVTRLLDKSSTPERGPLISELWRIRGEIVLRQSASDSQEAERYFGTALRIADKQGANVFRLRAGIPLARMLAQPVPARMLPNGLSVFNTACTVADSKPRDDTINPRLASAFVCFVFVLFSNNLDRTSTPWRAV